MQIQGQVDANGNPIGQGFTSQKTGTGNYRVIFDTPFGGSYNLTTNPVNPAQTVQTSNISKGGFDAEVMTGRLPADGAFLFNAQDQTK